MPQLEQLVRPLIVRDSPFIRLDNSLGAMPESANGVTGIAVTVRSDCNVPVLKPVHSPHSALLLDCTRMTHGLRLQLRQHNIVRGELY